MPTPTRRRPKILRPMPPADIGRFQGDSHWPVDFMPGRDVMQWIAETVIADTGALHNPDHRHLEGADLEVLWAASGFAKAGRSEEHTSELQSLMRISYAVFCLKKKTTPTNTMNRYVVKLTTLHTHTN